MINSDIKKCQDSMDGNIPNLDISGPHDWNDIIYEDKVTIAL